MKCEYHPDKDCRFLHKCHSLGCRNDPADWVTTEKSRFPTQKLPWRPGYREVETEDVSRDSEQKSSNTGTPNV